MGNTKNLKVIFTGVTDDLSKAFATVSAQAASTGSKLESMGTSLKSTGSEMDSLGRTMTTAFTVPVLGVGIAAAKMAMTFQQAMTYVRTDAGDTTDNIDQLSQSVLNLAKKSQFSPDELANGLYHLASLGLRGADAMNALNTAQQMASVGGADLESTASALGAALVTGIRGVQDYAQAAGALDAIIGQGNMRMQDLVGALGSGILPVAKNAGLSLTDVGAALATLTDNGMGAEESATRLRMTFALMEAPSKKAQGVLESVGMTSNQLAMDMRTKGLIPALQDLKTHLTDTYGTTEAGKTKMAAALTEIFGGGRSSAAAQTLIDELDRMQTKFNAIGQQSGEFSQKVAEQQETAAAKMKTAWNGVQADLIELGGKLLPVLAEDFTKLTNEIDKLTHWWDTLSQGQQQFIEKTIEVMAVMGPATSIVGKFFGTFGTLMKLGGGAVGLISKVFGGGAEVAGVAAGAGEATGALGSLATILTGPVGIGLVAAGAAATGLYLAVKHFENLSAPKQNLSDFNRLAGDLGVTVTGTSSKVDLLTLAQNHQQNAQKLVDAATQKTIQSQEVYSAQLQVVKQRNDDVKAAQDGVKQALDKYGQSSPQYQAAVQNLHDKQSALNDELYKEIGYDLTVKKYSDDLKDARKELTGATDGLNSIQWLLNKGLDAGLTTVSKFGSTAVLQVGGIETLQQSIGKVVTSFSSMEIQIQNQSPAINSHLQGLGSTIDRLQSQSTVLNTSLQNAGVKLQGGNVKLQAHASGTNYAPGGLSLVGEEGPELINLPRGSQVRTARETQHVTNSRSITIGTIVLASSDAVKEMFKQLDRDNLLVNKGLTPARGMS